MEIFVYRETNDNNCFDEEFIKLFKDLDTAKAYLELRARKYFSCLENREITWEEIENNFEIEYLSETRIVYDSGDGYMFFTIESYYVVY